MQRGTGASAWGLKIDGKLLKPVTYVKQRPALHFPLTPGTIEGLLYTKYRDWSYEDEVRGWFRLEERDPSGHYFYQFDEKIRLTEVIAGPLCDVSRATLDAALAGYTKAIRVIKARLAFTAFRIVEDKRGFRA